MADPPSLKGPRAKLARAETHRQHLDAAMLEYLALEPFRVTAPVLSDDGSLFEMFGFTEPEPPDYLGLVLGDYVNNLRGALDHLVGQLALLAGAAPTRAHLFPISSHAHDFTKRAGKALAGLREDHVAAIERLQPLNSPISPDEHPLALLQWLSNTDKHRVIHSFASSVGDADPETAGFRLTAGAGTLRPAQVNLGASVAHGEPVLRVALDPPDPAAKAEWYGQFDVRMVFGDRRARQESVQALQGVVTVIVEHFAEDFGG